jgi:hypothetical protein
VLLSSGLPVIHEDLTTEKTTMAISANQSGLSSMLAIPVFDDETLVSVVVFYF